MADEWYIRHGLTGRGGELKRNFLDIQRDEALRYLRPDKDLNVDLSLVTRKDLKAGLEASAEFFEGFGTLVKSIVPGGEQVVEFASFTKQLCKLGAKWLDRD
jgi:hypothetical protein